jgi:putative flippase GtrA
VSLTGSLVVAAVVARLASASLNYEVNRRWVSADGGRRSGGWRGPARYAVLASGILVVNVVLLDVLVPVVGSVLVAKVATEPVLFLVSFVIQRHVVFARPHPASAWESMPARAVEPATGSAPLSTSR